MWKRAVFLSLILALVLGNRARASELWITDPFPGAGTDVIGDRTMFDIQKAAVRVDESSSQIDLFYNFGPGQRSLAPWIPFYSIQLDTGDLLLSVNGAWAFGIPLVTHAGSPNGGPAGGTVQAGHVYQIDATDGVQTAKQVLNNPGGVIYRPDQAVWLWNHQGSLTDVATGWVTVAAFGVDGTTSPKFQVTIDFPTPPELYQAYADGTLAMTFASATCGNDVISGLIVGRVDDPPEVPEPNSAALLGGGLLLLVPVRFFPREAGRVLVNTLAEPALHRFRQCHGRFTEFVAEVIHR